MIKRTTLSLLLALALVAPAVAQSLKTERVEWAKQFDKPGRDEAWHIHQLPNDEYLLTGSTSASASLSSPRQAFIQVYRKNATVDSEIIFHALNHAADLLQPEICSCESQGYEIHPVQGGLGFDYVFAGWIKVASGQAKGLAMGLRRNGSSLEFVWTKTFPENDTLTDIRLYTVQQIMDNGISQGFVFAGFQRPFGVNQYEGTDALLIKTDNMGNLAPGWPVAYNDAASQDVDVFKSVRYDASDSTFVAVGFTRSALDEFNTLAIKARASDGVEVWPTHNSIGDNTQGQFSGGIKPAGGAGGGWVVAGGQWGPVDTGLGQAHLIKVNSFGQEEWTKRISQSSANSYANSLITLNPGTSGGPEYILAGAMYFGQTPGQVVDGQLLVAKFGSDGTLGYSIRAGGDDELEHANWVQPTADTGFVIAGMTYHNTDSLQRESDILIVKLAIAQEICGDVTGDGAITIADVFAIRDFVYYGASLRDTSLADVNADNSCPDPNVTSADMIYLTNYMFSGGPPPSCSWCIY